MVYLEELLHNAVAELRHLATRRGARRRTARAA